MSKIESRPMGRGPRGRMGGFEKPKNFTSAIKRLLFELKDYKILIIVSCILAMIGSILSIIAPNKLSKLTDEIGKGLAPNQNNISALSNEITNNLNMDNLKKEIPKILDIKLDVDEIMKSDISDSDKEKFNNIISDKDNITKRLIELPDSVLSIILKDSVYKDVHISKEDKIVLIKEKDLKNVELPVSIQKVIFNNITFDGVKISQTDQYKFLKVMSSLSKNSKPNDVYKKIDKLPKSIKKVIKPNMNLVKIKVLAFILLLLYFISSLFNFIESVIMASLSNKFANNLRSKISLKINKLPLKYFDKHLSGDILSRVTNDVDMIAQTMNQSLASLVSSITLFLGTFIMMFLTNWIMALTAIISSAVGFLLMSIILKKSQKYFKARQEELGNLNGHIEETYSGLNIVKAYNGNKEADEKFNKFNRRVCESNKKSQFISGLMQPIMGFIGNFGYVAVCIVGALLTMNNVITFGVIVAFMTYIRLFTQPLSQIAQAMTSMQSAAAASERVFEFIDEENMKDDKTDIYLDLKDVKGEISFENVVFKYEGNEKPTIKDFTAIAHPGEKIAIVGPTGAGKTTMVNLLMKFYDIESGDIKIDGVSTNNLSRSNIHSLFTMVLQDTWLFEGTIMDNIKFNRKNASDQDVARVCKDVGLDHFIKTLPKGYNTKISDNDNVSAGQRQLLTIARGMIEDSPFLILDEATSNVDTRTEELVSKAMDKLSKGKTSFIIAHRLSTIKNADLILVMKDGNIAEQGSHDELMKKNGFYTKLYNAQFEENI